MRMDRNNDDEYIRTTTTITFGPQSWREQFLFAGAFCFGLLPTLVTLTAVVGVFERHPRNSWIMLGVCAAYWAGVAVGWLLRWLDEAEEGEQ